MEDSPAAHSSPVADTAPGHVFYKMQAVGNDFVLFDRRAEPLDIPRERRRSLADRRLGIGCDQLIVLSAAEEEAGLFCRFYNADGGEAGMCGNGLRCVGHYLYARGELAAETLTPVACVGRVVSLLALAGGDIRVDMGEPAWSAARDGIVAGGSLQPAPMRTGPVEFTAVSMGNPHAVVRVPDVDEVPLEEWRSERAWRSLFPEGVNIGCMTVVDRRNARLRVYERGVGETPGCGSGACAAVAVGRRHGWLDRSVRVWMSGGGVDVVCSENGTIWLSGPAVQVYEGRIVI